MTRCVAQSFVAFVGLFLLGSASIATAQTPAAASTSKPPSSTATSKAATSKAATLERSIREALTQAQSLKTSPDSDAVRRMLDLYRQVEADTQLPLARREALRRALAVRLNQWQTILAQQLPLGGLGQPQANQTPDTLGPELVELIEEAIRPMSWDNVGGPGVIRFWGPANVLVVRQTTEAHEDLQKLLNDLR